MSKFLSKSAVQTSFLAGFHVTVEVSNTQARGVTKKDKKKKNLPGAKSTGKALHEVFYGDPDGT
ncbi:MULTISPECIES: hypothetical protein [unclassified Corynebacterium]|uniref:hypothetical protein n=1 Tax=unclassified Corynebacterium TaxID=2624378 RepID=UPI001AF002C2|nr:MULTISPECIES: hypothetical protein [unclassified Corynebacterium]MCG7457300.1 hypothetical protein [Corynebacterium sp. ACRPH]